MFETTLDPLRVDIEAEKRAVVHRGRERLCPSIPPNPPVTTRRPVRSSVPKCWRPCLRKGFIGALEDALGANVDPRARGHLPVHHEALLLQFSKVIPRGPLAHEVRVRDQDARRILMRSHNPHGFPD